MSEFLFGKSSAAALVDPPTANELALVDLSSIAYPIWHMSQSEPDPNATSTKIVDRVRALTSQHPHAAICCDSGVSFRKAIDPTYKAQRPEADASLHHQIALAKEQLAADGYPVWAVTGFEADDLIASATKQALAIDGTTVLIVSADKDLLQLVGPRVNAKSVRDGSIINAAAVKAKFGVTPDQMGDYLALVGDASDNIIGAKGIGAKRAVEILTTGGTLDAVYLTMDNGVGAYSNVFPFPSSIYNSLVEFSERRATVQSLIALRFDVEIPFAEIAAERTAKVAAFVEESMEPISQAPVEPAPEQAFVSVAEAVKAAIGAKHEPERQQPSAAVIEAARTAAQGQALAVREPDVLQPAPIEWEKGLEPRSQREARDLATAMFQARMFNGYGSAPAVLSTIMAGRELGLQAIASLRGFHIVEGRHALAADLIRALVLKSGLAKSFRCTERTAMRATFVTVRGDDPPIELTYSIEEGRRAFGFVDDMNEKELAAKEAAWAKSGWGRNGADMCVARAGSKLARLVYPEVTFGLYSPEELHD